MTNRWLFYLFFRNLSWHLVSSCFDAFSSLPACVDSPSLGSTTNQEPNILWCLWALLLHSCSPKGNMASFSTDWNMEDVRSGKSDPCLLPCVKAFPVWICSSSIISDDEASVRGRADWLFPEAEMIRLLFIPHAASDQLLFSSTSLQTLQTFTGNRSRQLSTDRHPTLPSFLPASDCFCRPSASNWTESAIVLPEWEFSVQEVPCSKYWGIQPEAKSPSVVQVWSSSYEGLSDLNPSCVVARLTPYSKFKTTLKLLACTEKWTFS